MRSPSPADPIPPDLRKKAEEIEQSYIEGLRRGRIPDREEILAGQPELAPWLEEHLALLEILYAGKGMGERVPRAGGLERGDPGEPCGSVGPYRLLERLGEGGMGSVYLAEQDEPIRRRVAVKVIKLGMDTRDVIARFEAERQALALMEHPGIARVFDGGATASGRPYFVMEVVRGKPITEFCDERRLPTADRLRLFVDVCEAVQHAHQKGVVHRDLKPSNILVSSVDEKPRPKIIDFGVAKATNRGVLADRLSTDHGRILGTAEYMSPEQAAGSGGDIDTRSDIYSLGVLLYRLLVGAFPFDGDGAAPEGLDELRRQIITRDPPKPSTRIGTPDDRSREVADRRGTDLAGLGRQVRGDLDWITMKAMERDRARRYATASELAADIQRHLASEPVLAGPPSRTYRLGKFLRRNRVPAAAGALVLLSLVGGMAASTVLWRRAGRERDAAVQARAAEARERERSQRQAERARAISEALQKILSSVNPLVRGGEPTVRELLADAAAEVEGRFAYDPLVEASLRSTIGQSYVGLGLESEAAPHVEAALEIRRARLGADHPDTVSSRVAWGHILLHRGELEQAESIFRDVLRWRTERLGPHDPRTLAAQHMLGSALRIRGLLPESEATLRQVLEARRGSLGDDHEDTLATMDRLAHVLQMRGRLEEAEVLYDEEIRRRGRTQGEEHPAMLLAQGNLGSLLEQSGRWEEAEAILSRTVEAGRRVLGEDHPHTLQWVSSLGGLLLVQGRLDEARTLSSNVLESMQESLGEEHLSTLAAMNNHALVLRAVGDGEGAEMLHRSALRAQERILGDDHPTTLQSASNLGLLLADQGRLREAEPLLRRALLRRREVLGADHHETLRSLTHLAHIRWRLGEGGDAERLFRSALEGQRSRLGDRHPDTLRTIHDLGELRSGQGVRDEETAALLGEALEGRRAVLGPGHDDTLAAADALAVVLASRGERVRATDILRSALGALEGGTAGSSGSRVRRRLSLRHNLGSLLIQTGDLEEAGTHLRAALAGRREILGDLHPDTFRSMGSLAILLRFAGHREKAEKLLRRTLALGGRIYPRGHWELACCERELGRCLAEQGRFSQAEGLLRQAESDLRASLGADHEQAREALRCLARLYEDWGRPGDAEEIREKIDAVTPGEGD